MRLAARRPARCSGWDRRAAWAAAACPGAAAPARGQARSVPSSPAGSALEPERAGPQQQGLLVLVDLGLKRGRLGPKARARKCHVSQFAAVARPTQDKQRSMSNVCALALV
eukprot:4891374-Prymnesium_polylepis.1